MATGKAGKARLVLRLYVAGRAPNSVRAIASVEAICALHFSAAHELEIVDMLEQPERALADGIIATPTLLKLRPQPVRRMIGDLSDTSLLLRTLGGP